MKKQFLLLVFVSLLFSLGFTREETAVKKSFQNNVYSFNYPNDWEITFKDSIRTKNDLITIVKKGTGGSAVITIKSEERSLDLDKSIELSKDTYQKSKYYKDLKFDKIKGIKFNGLNARSLGFSFKAFNTTYQAETIGINSNKKSVILTIQQDIKKLEKNKEGLQMIESSFKIK